MAGITVAYGRVQKIAQWQTYLNSLTLRLYKNNRGVPLVGDTVSLYTESTFTGYGAIPLGSWGTAFLNGMSQGEIDEIIRVFTCTVAGPPESVYGYYITDGAGALIMVQQGSTVGVVIQNPGDSYAVVPKDVLGDLCP